jgi:proton-coupled amino acid transporter
MLTYVVAVAVPNVQSLISLAGALAGSSTALLIPPALELAWVYQSGARHIGEALEATSINTATTNPWKVGRCYVLLIGGFIFMVIGTVASIADIFEAYTSVS